jgi:hypothetical protein
MISKRQRVIGSETGKREAESGQQAGVLSSIMPSRRTKVTLEVNQWGKVLGDESLIGFCDKIDWF